MLDLLKQCINKVKNVQPDEKSLINIHHNYCQKENIEIFDTKFNKFVEKSSYITRKGATSAKKGE